MRSGVVLCIAASNLMSPSNYDRLYERLQAKAIPVLRYPENLIAKGNGKIAEFVVQNRLQRLIVVSSLSKASVMDSLRYEVERTGLGSLSVSYLDSNLLWRRETLTDDTDAACTTILVNLARLEHADHLKDAVLKTALTNARISRRQLVRSIPHAFKIESDIPIIVKDRCVHRSSSCNYCVKACPVSAISLTKESVTIDNRLCIECGACTRECPIGAIQSPSASDAQILAMLNTLSGNELKPHKRVLLLTCPAGLEKLASEAGEDRPLDPSIIPAAIPCIAPIGSIHYLWAASLGITLVTICPNTSCQKVAAVIAIQRHVESSKSLLNELGEDGAAIQHLNLTENDSVIHRILPLVSFAQVPLRKGMPLSGRRREATLNALKTLQEEKHSRFSRHDDGMLPFFDLAIDAEKCGFCGVCERDCPDHAISFIKNETSSSLMFDPALCGGCMICEKTCPELAVKVSRHGQLSEVVEGKKMTKVLDESVACERCGAPLGSKRSLTILEKKLSDQTFPDAIIRTLRLCVRCKSKNVFAPQVQ